MRTTCGTIAAFLALAVGGSAARAASSDFDGDGISDIVWRHDVTGRNQLWPSARTGTRKSLPTVQNGSWIIAAIGDFQGDGRADLFWRYAPYGANAMWPNGKPARVRVHAVRERSFIDAVGDFDGDGTDDLFWRNLSTGGNALWPSAQPGGIQVRAVQNLQWQVHGAGDFDGDGVDDVFWRNPYTGANTVWLSAMQETQLAVAPLSGDGWLVIGVGDFDGDGIDEVAWHDWQTGENMVWPGADAALVRPLAWIDTDRHGWRGQVGDYDGDGSDDLLWRHPIEGHGVIWHAGDATDTRVIARVADRNWKLEPGRTWECDADRVLWAQTLNASTAVYEKMMYAAQARSYAVGSAGYVRNRLTILVDESGRVEDAYCG